MSNAVPENTDAAVVMRDVDKWYDSYHALTSINLTVARGEKIVVCGPSGSGKSTLIRCINQLETIRSGTITVDGIELQRDGKFVV